MIRRVYCGGEKYESAYVCQKRATDKTERTKIYAEYGRSNYLPLPLQAWWLDAVCGEGNWDAALATDGNGRVTGLVPYWTTRRWRLPVVQLPPFSAYAGPWLHYPADADFRLSSRYSFEQRTMAALIAALPRPVFFTQNFHPSITNWLPFHHAGFRQTTRYTYILDKIEDAELVFRQFKNPLRLKLRKAAEATEVLRDDSAADLVLRLNTCSFRRKKLAPPQHAAAFARLHEALVRRNQCAVFIARDRRDGSPHAGLYLAFDERQASAKLAGFVPERGAYCGLYGLYREAIVFCAERGLSLDFDGGMDAGVGQVFRAFGASMVPFFQVWRGRDRWLEALYALR